MTTFRVARFAAFIALPPAIGTALALGLDIAGGGQARCVAELDVATAPVVCLPVLTFVVTAGAFIAIHLFVALPLSWWAARRDLPMRSLLLWLGVAIALLLAPLTFARSGQLSVGQALWENYGALGLPLFAMLAAALALGRYVVARRHRSPIEAAA